MSSHYVCKCGISVSYKRTQNHEKTKTHLKKLKTASKTQGQVKIACPCGSIIQLKNKKHVLSIKHQKFLMKGLEGKEVLEGREGIKEYRHYELSFLQHLQKTLINKELTKEEVHILNQLGIHALENDKVINVVSGKQKKSDVIIKLKNSSFGISYKRTKARTIQSWSSNQLLYLIFGERNMEKLIEHTLNKTLAHVQKSNHVFLGSTFHIVNHVTDTKLSDVIRISDDIIRKIHFGTHKDASHCVCIFQNDTFNHVENIYDLLTDTSCITTLDTPRLHELYIQMRYPYYKKTTSNNSAQLLVHYKPNEHITNISLKNMLDYGSFIPSYKNKINTRMCLEFIRNNVR